MKYRNGLPVWGAKGRRSAIDLPPSPRQHFPPEKKPKFDSPPTPFAFPVSESEDKIRQKTLPKKKTTEELLETLKELVQAKKLLTKELEKVKIFHNTRKAYNAVLKAKQQELQLKRRKPNSQPSLHLDMDLSLSITPFPLFTENHQTHNPRFSTLIQQQHSNNILQYPFIQTPPLSSSLVSATVNHMGPLGLSDLNEIFDTEDLQSLDRNLHSLGDDNKSKAAEARKRRKVRLRKMKLNTALFRTSKC